MSALQPKNSYKKYNNHVIAKIKSKFIMAIVSVLENTKYPILQFNDFRIV